MSIVLALALAQPALAADGDKKPEIPPVNVTALVFAHYAFSLDKAAAGTGNANSFDLDRAYFGATSQVSEHLGVKVLFDAGRLDDTTADTKLRVFAKNAWLEASSGKVIKARFGVVDTGYIPYEEAFIGGRYVAKMMADDQKVMSTADIGVNAQGEASGGLLSWHAAVLNGEGYSKPELDAGKTGSARVSLNPLSKSETFALPITGYVSYAIPGAKGVDGVTVAVGAIGLKVPHVLAWAEYVERLQGSGDTALNSGGFSVTVSPRMPKYAGLLLRVDDFDPDQSAKGDSTMKIIAGVNHDFLPKVSASLAYERAQPETGTATHGIYVNMQAGF